MSEHHLPPDEQAMADALRRAARGSRPAFSPELHARICRAVEQTRAGHHPGAPRRALQARARRPWLAALLAAACTLFAAAIAWQTWRAVPGPTSRPQVLVADGVAPDAGALSPELDVVTDMAYEAAETLDDFVATAIRARRWGYLDRDARLAVGALAERLPFGLAAVLSDGTDGDE